MGPEQRQQQRDFFLRTDLDHGDLLFAPLVGPKCEDVQDDLVSGLFQTCFAGQACPTGRRPECPDAVRRPCRRFKTNKCESAAKDMTDRRSVDEILAAIRTNNVVAPALSPMDDFEHLTDQSVLRLYDAITTPFGIRSMPTRHSATDTVSSARRQKTAPDASRTRSSAGA
jgi:hypothetical protein